jgi:hypothetical protein
MLKRLKQRPEQMPKQKQKKKLNPDRLSPTSQTNPSKLLSQIYLEWCFLIVNRRVTFHDDVITDDIGKQAYDMCKNYPSRRILLDTIRRLQKAYGIPKERMYMRLGINCQQIGNDSKFMNRDRQSNPVDFVRDVNLAKVRKLHDQGKTYSIGRPKYRTTKFESILKPARSSTEPSGDEELGAFDLLLRDSQVANHNRETRLLNSQYRRANIIYPENWLANSEFEEKESEISSNQSHQPKNRLLSYHPEKTVSQCPQIDQERLTPTKKRRNDTNLTVYFEKIETKFAPKKKYAPFTWWYNCDIPEKYSEPYAPGWPVPYVQWVHPSIQKNFGEIAILIYDTENHEGHWRPPKPRPMVGRRHRAEGVFFVRQRNEEENGDVDEKVVEFEQPVVKLDSKELGSKDNAKANVDNISIDRSDAL